MKTVLVFEYEHKLEDGIGTRNDALVCAVDALLKKINWADSTDDLGQVFREIHYGDL